MRELLTRAINMKSWAMVLETPKFLEGSRSLPSKKNSGLTQADLELEHISGSCRVNDITATAMGLEASNVSYNSRANQSEQRH